MSVEALAPPVALASPTLQACLQQLEALRQEACVLCHGLDGAAFNWQPAPERWSVGQCLDHLNHAGALLLPRLDEAIARGRAAGVYAEGPTRYGWLGRWWVRAMHPTCRRRFRAPAAYLPAAEPLDPDDVLATFLDVQDALAARLEAADGLDLARLKVRSPAYAWMRLPLGVWFESTLAHEERHLAQARQVMAQPGFPRFG